MSRYALLFDNTHSLHIIFAGKAPLGETCDKDTDCDNKGSVCLRGSCQCHPYYVRMTSEKMPNGRCVTCELIQCLIFY